MALEPLMTNMPESLPLPNEGIEFDNDHGEYVITGEDESTWLIVGIHGSELLTAFSGLLTLHLDGYAFEEHRPELVTRFAGETDWRAPLGTLFASELEAERDRLAHPGK
jgi:hypothetical protein